MVETMEIRTSYFAKPGLDTNDMVSISRWSPKWLPDIPTYIHLAPPSTLLKNYKAGIVSDADYKKIYTAEVLDRLNPITVANDLDGKILCCYEKPSTGFYCHRQLVAKWLQYNLGIIVTEI